MCGIAGLLSSSKSIGYKNRTATEMLYTLNRRGPDEGGVYNDENILLVHRRLAVVDLENGKQPMIYERGNEKYVIVYNGELYNTEEVRDRLKQAGYKFNGTSDTEVVLKAYAEFKEDCCEKLNGIFAFAVYETFSKKLFLCRDRIGVKPLFFSCKKDELVFASEIKALLCTDLCKPEVDENGLYELFFLGPARSSGCGIFKNIQELLPGEYLSFYNGNIKRHKYFKLTANEHIHNEEETINHTRFLIEDSIKRQLVSDVPLCTFLSGGLDSSIITLVASEKMRNDGKVLNSYSVEYKDNEKFFTKSVFQPNRDYEYIKMMSEFTNSLHKEVIIDNSLLADALEEATIARDLPGMADVDSSLLLFCREVKKDFTVALSGECADELFGGYPWYHREDILFDDCFPWSKSTDLRKRILKKGLLPKGDEFVRQKYLDTIQKTDKLNSDSVKDARMREMFVLNFYWFMQCLLDRKDRMSMYSGLEVRVPFCDYRIVEYAYNMPWHLKAYMGREKGIVRKAFENKLPHEITYRKKSPYPKTHSPEYMKKVSNAVLEILSKKSMLTELIDKNEILRIIENPDSITEPWYGQLMRAPQILAYIIELFIWLEKYKVKIV